MTLGGLYVDADDPDSFTWMRGFADHQTRVRSLEMFYGGPVWARHCEAANATMVNSDDVLVLRPTQPAHEAAASVPRGGTNDRPRSERVLVITYGLTADIGPVEEWFATTGVPEFEDILDSRVAAWRTDPTPNGFPRLPVCQERALACLATFPDGDTRDAAAARLAAAEVSRELDQRTSWQRTFRLAPTKRSAHSGAKPIRGAGADTRPAAAR